MDTHASLPDRSITVRLGANGRIVIPAAIRAQMGWKTDEPLRLRLDDEGVRIESVMDGVRRAQALFRKLDKGTGSMVDELIAERRAESLREMKG